MTRADRVVLVVVIFLALAAVAYRLHRTSGASTRAEAVVERFLWALDRGDVDAARQYVFGTHYEAHLRRAAALLGPQRPIRRLTFTGNSDWSGRDEDGWWVSVWVEWRKPHAPWECQYCLFWVSEGQRPEAWALGFQLRRGKWWGPWKIVQAQGGC